MRYIKIEVKLYGGSMVYAFNINPYKMIYKLKIAPE